MEVVGMYATAREAIESAIDMAPDVCVLPRLRGARGALRAGAHGYVGKSLEAPTLVAAVGSVAVGQAMYPQPLMRQLFASFTA